MVKALNETQAVLEKINERADAFIKMANKKFGVNLDFSEESLIVADDLITMFFKKHRQHFYQAAVLIGCYLGEVIIKNLGGKWLTDHSIKKVGKTKLLVKPINKAGQRLASGLSASLTLYYRTLKANSCFDLSFAKDEKKIERNYDILIKNKWDQKLLDRITDEGEPRYVREEAADVINRIHSKDILNKLLKTLEDHGQVYYAAIALQGFKDDKMYKPLMKALKEARSNIVKIQIMLALGNLGNNGCVDELIEFLRSEDELLAYYASIAIGKIGGDKALKYLLDILGGLTKGRRVYAISALELMGDKRSVPALIETLFSRDDELCEAAVRALQFIPDQRAFKPLMYLLKEPSANVRILAAYALANVDKKKALEAVKTLLKDEVELVRQHADNIIKHIEAGNGQMLKCI
ncbi:MAG: HEAT repeat domain-containing protein [Armatimonadota bacterium]